MSNEPADVATWRPNRGDSLAINAVAFPVFVAGLLVGLARVLASAAP